MSKLQPLKSYYVAQKFIMCDKYVSGFQRTYVRRMSSLTDRLKEDLNENH